MKLNHKILSIIFLITLSNSVMTDTIYKKPYYGIKLDLAQVGVDIRVNDIPVYYDDQKGQLNVDLAVPSSIIDGKNEIKIIAFPPFMDESNKVKMEKFLPDSVVTVDLYVQEIDDPENKIEILSSLSIKFDDNHQAIVLDKNESEHSKVIQKTTDKSIITKTFNVVSPFPRWSWQDGKNIENTKENYTTLLAAYKEIHDAYSNKDKESIFKFYNERAKEIALAYHLNGAKEGHIKISTGEDMLDDSLELYTFWDQNMILDVYGNGKLARIIGNTEPSIHPVIYLDREAGLLHKHKYGFYKSKDDKWIMIR